MRRRVVLLIGLVALLSPAAGALAGGWVVVTLEALPERIKAGELLELSFMVRQHGWVPTHDVSPVLTVTNTDTGRQIRAEATPASKIGQFIVAVNFPEAGAWEWSISAEPFMQTTTFAPLDVLAAETAVGLEQSEKAGAGQQVAPKQMAAPGQVAKSGAGWQVAAPEQSDLSGVSFRVLLRVAGLALLGAAGTLMVISRRRKRELAPLASGDQTRAAS